MFSPRDSIGPYTLIRPLGEGQFGVVWLARRAGAPDQQEVALKILKHPYANDILQEVLNWARAGDHDNILTIIDARHLNTPSGRLPVIVSGYVRDGSLRQWLAARAPVSAETAVEVARGILDGLVHLHRRNIIHRDLKPENVLMDQGRPVLTDFGLARLHGDGADVLTAGIQGTIEYMAPESFRSVRAPQLDVWAAAVICYEMLAGRRPYPRDPHAICTQPLPPLPNSVPLALRRVIEQALNQDEAQRRYKEAPELRAALLEVVGLGTGESTLARIPDAPTVPAALAAVRPILPQEIEPPRAHTEAPRNLINLRGGSFRTKNLIMGPAEQSAPAGSSTIDIEFKNVEVSEDTKINH